MAMAAAGKVGVNPVVNLTHVEAGRSLRAIFCDVLHNRPELFGLVLHEGYTLVPQAAFEDCHIVQGEGWNKLLDAVEETKEAVKARNIHDAETRRDWLDGKDV